MLINVKMPTIVDILTFMSRINSCSAELSIQKSIITSGPCVLYVLCIPFCCYSNAERMSAFAIAMQKGCHPGMIGIESREISVLKSL